MRKIHETICVREIACQAERNSYRSGALVADASAEIIERKMPRISGEACAQFFRGNSQRDFAGAGIAEAAGSQGDVHAFGAVFDYPMLDQALVRIEEVESDRAAAGLCREGAVDQDRRPAVFMPQPV